jgi:hypothetical protein
MRLKNYFSLSVLLIVYATAISGGYWYWGGKPEEISAWAVALAGAVVLWYTWETMHLRRIAFDQRELQLRPFIVFRKEAEGYVLENVGNGAALDVWIENIKIGDESKPLMEIRFPHHLPFLRKDSIAAVIIEVYIKGNREEDIWGTAHLDPKYAVNDINVKIHFSNIEGKGYIVEEVFSPGKISIEGFSDTAFH